MEHTRYYVNFTKSSHVTQLKTNPRLRAIFPLEYRDDGAYFYRENFLPLGDRHQNWFGILPNGEGVAVSLARVVLRNGQRARCQSLFTRDQPPSSEPSSPIIQSEYGRSTPRTMGKSDCPDQPKRRESDLTGPEISRRTATSKTNGHADDDWIPAWLVIVRREKGFDLRCCVIDRTSGDGATDQRVSAMNGDTYLATSQHVAAAEAKKAGLKASGGVGLMRSSTKKDQFTRTVVTMDSQTQAMLRFITQDQLHPEELQLGQADPSVYEKLASLDELELLDKHKFGVLLCRSNQSTESEMYNNENSTPTFDRFLNLLGRRVPLKDYTGYTAGLDTKTNATGLETCVTEFNGFPVAFLVSTFLPFHTTASEQVARKRHVGNSAVTIIFQEPDALPFDADSILSRFQQVFIVVRLVQIGDDTPRYRVAVCSASGVPPFGPAIDEDHLYEHNPEFASLLLEKACNAANAALKSDKFQAMIRRSRTEYLQQFAKDYVWSSPIIQHQERKHSPFRSIGRKRLNRTSDSLQLTSTSDHRQSIEMLPRSKQASKSITFNSTLDLKQSHSNRRSKEKRSHRNNVVSPDSTSSSDTASFTTAPHNRSPATIQLTCLDFGHTFFAQLHDLQTLCGRKSAAMLLAGSRTSSDCSKQNNSQPDPTIVLTLSSHWMVVTTLGCSDSSGPRILFATRTRSIFAYAFEANESVIALYMDYAQCIRLKSGESNDDANVCHQIRHFLLEAMPPGSLCEVHELTLKWTNLQDSVSPGDTYACASPTNHPTDETSYQRRKSINGKRCALTDLGLHISFTGVSTTIPMGVDRKREALSLPCVFKTDADSPAQRAGLHRGQIILKIGTHEMPELFRAVACLPASPDGAKSTVVSETGVSNNPFSVVGSPAIRSEMHVAADLLNLIRQLRFAQDIPFAVGSLVKMTDQWTGAKQHHLHPVLVPSSPMISRISFPYLRRPANGRSSHPAPIVANRKPKLDPSPGPLGEPEPHTPRRLSNGAVNPQVSEANATNQDSLLWTDQLKPRRPLLNHKYSLDTTKRSNILPLSKSALNRLGTSSLKLNSDAAGFENRERCILLDTPRSVRWSFDTLTDNEIPSTRQRKLVPTVQNAPIEQCQTEAKAVLDEHQTDKHISNGRIRVWDGLCHTHQSIQANGDQAVIARVQKKPHHKILHPQTNQAHRIAVVSSSSQDDKLRSRSNPQLFRPAIPDSGSANSLKQSQEKLDRFSPSHSPLGAQNGSYRIQNSHDSDQVASSNASLRQREKMHGIENSKRTIWYPMCPSPLQPPGTSSDKERPATSIRFQHSRTTGDNQSHDELDCHSQSAVYLPYYDETCTGAQGAGQQPRAHMNSTDAISPQQLHQRVQELEKQLKMEQKRRFQMASMCASLLQENQQLRTGRLNEEQPNQSASRNVYHHPAASPTHFQPDPAHVPLGRGRNAASPTTASWAIRPPRQHTTTITLTGETRGMVKFLPRFGSETDI